MYRREKHIEEICEWWWVYREYDGIWYVVQDWFPIHREFKTKVDALNYIKKWNGWKRNEKAPEA